MLAAVDRQLAAIVSLAAACAFLDPAVLYLALAVGSVAASCLFVWIVVDSQLAVLFKSEER